jgi:hypothetical protein
MPSPGNARTRVKRTRTRPTIPPPKTSTAYKPTDLVSARQIAEHYGISVCSVRGWVERGILFVKKKGYRRTHPHLYLWSDVVALNYTPGVDCRNADSLCPPGHVTCRAAADKLGLSGQHIRRMAATGKIASYAVRLGGVGAGFRQRYLYFIPKAAIAIALSAAEAEARDLRKKGVFFTQAVITAIQKPLISPINDACLIARRELWQQASRVWPKKYGKTRISVAGGRRAG